MKDIWKTTKEDWKAVAYRLQDAYNEDAERRGKCVSVTDDADLVFWTRPKSEKPLTVRALVPTPALENENTRRSVLDYVNAKFNEANSEHTPATMRIKFLNPELSEVIVKPFDIEIEYLEGYED